MAQVQLFIDLTQSDCVSSLIDPSLAPLPIFVQGDTLNFRIYLIRSAGRYSPETPARIPTSGLTLEMALGVRGGTTYTSQFVWTQSVDAADPYWEASLPMNTAPLTSLLSGRTSAPATLDVKLVEGGTPRTILLKDVTINATVISAGAVVVPAGLTPMSAEAANATFQTLEEIKLPTYARDTVTGLRCYLHIESDGFHADPVA